MAISKKSSEEKKSYEVKVTRAKDFSKDGKTTIAFDMEANGVTIYGCWYRTATNKKGEEFASISFPSRKGEDGKYYSHAYFKIEADVLADIEKQIEALI